MKNVFVKLLTLFFPMMILLSSLSAKELTQKEREKIAAMLIPIYALLFEDDNSKVVLPLVVKKTGQTKSYDYTGKEKPNFAWRDDGHYRKGVDVNYTRDNVTEIVTDHLTDRQWQDDIGAKLAVKQWLTDENYDAHNYTNTSGDTAATFCKNLSLGGYNDWRLPTRKELLSITNYGRGNPDVQLDDLEPSIDPIFNNVSTGLYGGEYWTSTTYARFDYDAGIVDFRFGTTTIKIKDQRAHVRCVRIKDKEQK